MIRPSIRSLFGLIILLIGLLVYVGGVAWAAEELGTLPFLVEILFYAIAGVLWIIPVRYLMKWMTKAEQ